MKTFRLFWFLFPFFILAAAPVNAGVQAVFYVSPDGSGSVFSQAQPGNLFAARDQIRTMNTGMTGDIVVYLYGGVYPLTNSFQLQENTTNHDSGTGGYNIIYQAYPGSIPILSGGLTVTNWSLDNAATNIWRAYVGTNINSRQLYVNGVRAIRARSNLNPPGFAIYTNSSGAGDVVDATNIFFSTTNPAMQSWGNVTNIEFVNRTDWKQLRCPVAAISGTNIAMQMPGWNYTILPPTPGIPWSGSGPHPGVRPNFAPNFETAMWVENAYELLASPGMWYLNRATGYLYYIPRPDENMTNATVILPVVEKLVDASGGSLATPIHNVIFSGITFEYATWLLPGTGSGYADNQATIMWSGPTNALKTMGNVSFQTAADIQVTNDVFVHLGGTALDFGGGAHGNVIAGNHFDDISSSGISLGEVNDYATTDPDQMTDGNVIQDNYIRRDGAEYEDAAGIWVGYARNTLIAHNDIANTPYSGMSVGWGWGAYTYAASNHIYDNAISDVMQTLIDGGSFYELSAQTNSWITGNYFKGSAWNAIYWDEGSAYENALSNVVDDCKFSWISMWTNIDHDCVASNNFSNIHLYGNAGSNCIVTNTTYVFQQNWPSAAQAIIQNAGLEPGYDAISLPPTTVNDTAANCQYSGNWNYVTNSSAGDYDGDVHVSTNAGDSVTFSFFGTGVAAVCEKNAKAGAMTVYLDGLVQARVEGFSTNTQPQQTIFTAGNLSAQTHTLQLVNSGGSNILVDAFVVRGVPETIINDGDMVYDHVPADWTLVNSPLTHRGDFHADTHQTQIKGEYVQAEFTGPYIVWVGELNSDEGSVDVYVDDEYRATVNCHSTTLMAQQRLFTATDLSPGQHTITLVNAANDFNDPGSNLVVDAFIVTPTPTIPPAPLALNAVGGTNQVDLAWTASSGATGYTVLRSTVTGGPYTVIGNSTSTNYDDGGLSAGTTYYYVVSASNPSGTGNDSAEVPATTVPGAAWGIPAVPAGLILTLNPLVTGAQINLNWTASTGATGYAVKRATASGGPYVVIASPVGTSYTDMNLVPGTTYYYVVSAVNSFGESLDSTEVNTATAPVAGTAYQNAILGDGAVGYWPLDFSRDTNTDSSGNLLATDLSGNGNAGTYRYLTATGNTVAGPSISLPHAVNFNGAGYVDLGTGTNTNLLDISGQITMEAWVQPANAGIYGNIIAKGYDSSQGYNELVLQAKSGSYYGGSLNFDIFAFDLDVASAIYRDSLITTSEFYSYISAADFNGVANNITNLNWTYLVCTYDGADWNLYVNGSLASSTSSLFGSFPFADPWAIGNGTADGLSLPFTGNICQVALYTNALNGAQILNHYLLGQLGQPPTAPSVLVAAPRNARISLAWNPVTDAAGYSIKRSLTSGGTYSPVGGTTGTGYVDAGLTNGVTYYYVVCTTNAWGSSANSVEASATPLAPTPITLNMLTPAGGTFEFVFNGQSNLTYVVEESTNLINWFAVLTNSAPTSRIIFADLNATNQASFYRIRQ